MLVSETIEDLFGGVSQAPSAKRFANQFAEQINALPIFGKRLGRRPPLLHTAKLSSVAASASSFIYPVTTSTGLRAHIVIANGVVSAYDADTGAPITVDAPDGTSYVTGNVKPLRAASSGDSTVIVNPDVVVKKALTYAPPQNREALIFVRQGDYETNFTVTINTSTFTYTTPAASAGGAKAAIATDAIAASLIALFVADPTTNGAFNFTQYGSTIYAVRKNAADFTITTSDGISDKAMVLIKGTVQSFSDLPEKCRPGVIVEVTGGESSGFTSYFVRYDITGESARSGVWNEVVKPGSLLALDSSTMPYRVDFRGTYLGDTTHRTTKSNAGSSVLGSVAYGGGSATITLPEGKYFSAGMPIAVSFTVGFGTTQYSYAPATVEESAATVLAGLKAILDASVAPLWTSTISGNVLAVKRTDASAITATTYGQGFNDSTVFYNPSLSLTPNALVGKVIRNMTDGSQGTITGNSSRTITVLLLTGGTFNAFGEGNVCNVIGAGDYFLFAKGQWAQRSAGDEKHVPFPSFVTKALSEVFFHQGRLGLLSESTFVLSRAGDVFNLFRRSATQILDDDPIDQRNATGDASPFHSAVEWNQKLYVFSGMKQYSLGATDNNTAITPTSVKLVPTSSYLSDPRVRPVAAGNRLYFVALKSGFPRILEYRIKGFEQLHDAEDTGLHIPTYFQGNPLQLVVDESQGVLAFFTDGRNRKSIYIYSYRFQDDQKVAAGWSRWDFNSGTILKLDSVDGKMALITAHPDGLYLGSLLLDPQALAAYQRFDGSRLFDGSFNFGDGSALAGERIAYLDRRLCSGDSGSGITVSYAAGITTFTLPYAINVFGTDGVLAVCTETPMVVYATTRPAPNQVAVAGDLRNKTVYIGVLYNTAHTLGTLYLRAKDGEADERGRLQIRYLNIRYADTTDLTVTVTITGRPAQTYTLSSTAPSSGTLTVPIQGRNVDATVVISNGTPGAGQLVSFDWQGTHHTIERAL